MLTAQIQQNIDLRTLNTFGIQASARYFAALKDTTEFSTLMQLPEWQQLPKFILGGGSNVLFTQQFTGLIIKNEMMGIHRLAEDDDHVWLQVGAGENWHTFVLYCIEQGLGGVENLSLIPGTVGAAPIQNIGAYGVELCDVFEELTALDMASGVSKIFSREACQFGYRDSVFKSLYKNQYLITCVTLRLNKKPQFNLSYGALQQTLQDMHVTEPTLRTISEAVMQIRRSKLPDPAVLGNAGSFFKNPIIALQQFTALKNEFALMPHFEGDSPSTVKISAGWMIEQCGWKGKRVGEVGVYDKQALVLVNYGAGTGADIQQLVAHIQQSVFARFGVQLMPEVNII